MWLGVAMLCIVLLRSGLVKVTQAANERGLFVVERLCLSLRCWPVTLS